MDVEKRFILGSEPDFGKWEAGALYGEFDSWMYYSVLVGKGVWVERKGAVKGFWFSVFGMLVNEISARMKWLVVVSVVTPS